MSSRGARRIAGPTLVGTCAMLAVLWARPASWAQSDPPTLDDFLLWFQSLYAGEAGVTDPASDQTTRSDDTTANLLPHTDILAAWALLVLAKRSAQPVTCQPALTHR